MEQPSYLIINPLQLVLINEGKNVEKMSEIERQFYKKLRKLKNIDDNSIVMGYPAIPFKAFIKKWRNND